jgi:hypothetical protein
MVSWQAGSLKNLGGFFARSFLADAEIELAFQDRGRVNITALQRSTKWSKTARAYSRHEVTLTKKKPLRFAAPPLP